VYQFVKFATREAKGANFKEGEVVVQISKVLAKADKHTEAECTKVGDPSKILPVFMLVGIDVRGVG
jgi:hypothetical protein